MRRRELIVGGAALAAMAALSGVADTQIVRGVGRPRPAGTAVLNLVVHGDSFVAGAGVTTPIAQRLSTQIDNQYDQPNTNTGTTLGFPSDGFIYIASPGTHNFNFVGDVAQVIVPALSGSLPNWVVNVGDLNDVAIGGQTVAATYSALQTYCADLIAAGVPAGQIVFTCPCSRNGFSDSTRNAFIALLLADAGGIGYKVARNDQEALLCGAGAFSNTTYFQLDGIHPTDLGYQLLVIYIAKVMYG